MAPAVRRATSRSSTPRATSARSTIRPRPTATPSAASPTPPSRCSRELDEETVDFRPTYDGETTEPVYLPGARCPTCSSTAPPASRSAWPPTCRPHNLREVCRRHRARAAPSAGPGPPSTSCSRCFPGPTSRPAASSSTTASARPTRRAAARSACGPGPRSSASRARREAIVVTELPYIVGPERVIGRIKELVRDGKLGDIADVKNLSDRRSGLRIQIELQGRHQRRTRARRALPPDAARGDVRHQQRRARRRRAHHARASTTSASTTSTHRLDVVVRRTSTACARPASGCTSSRATSSRSTPSTVVIAIIRGSAQDVAEARQRLVDGAPRSQRDPGQPHPRHDSCAGSSRSRSSSSKRSATSCASEIAELREASSAPRRASARRC